MDELNSIEAASVLAAIRGSGENGITNLGIVRRTKLDLDSVIEINVALFNLGLTTLAARDDRYKLNLPGIARITASL